MDNNSLAKGNNFLNNRNKNIIFFAAFFAVAAFVLWRCQFGFAQTDEFLHLSIPYRMHMGDVLLAEEWHQTQLTGFVYYPITKLILTILGSADGVVLYSRIACVILELLVAFFLYFRLKKFNWFGAFAASIIFALYTPNALTSIFYYTVGMMAMTVVTVLVATAEKHLRRDYFIAGVFFAASVLSFPHVAFMYALYAVVVFIGWKKYKAVKKEFYGKNEFLSPELFGFFTLGITLLAVIFFGYVLICVPLDKLFASIKPIMTDAHHDITFVYKILVYFGSIFLYNNKIAGVLMVLLFAEMIFRKKLKNTTYFTVATALTIILQVHILTVNHQIDFFMFAPSCLGLFCIFLSDSEIVRRLAYTVYIPGIVFTFFLNLASNQGFIAVSAAATVSTVATAVMVAICVKELSNNATDKKLIKICKIVVMCLLVVQLSFQGYSRYVSIYGPGNIKEQNIKLEYGVMKGITVDSGHAADYDYYYDIVKTAEQNYNYEKVLTATKRSWMSFMFGKEICGFSAYLNYVDEEFMEKQEMYFEINPEKIPDIVYVQKENPEVCDWFVGKYSGYTADEYDFGYIIYKDGCKK